MNIPYQKQYVDGVLINPITSLRITRYPNRREKRKQLLNKNKNR